MIGWESSSWGYHGDDGFAFHGDRSGKPYGPTYTSKETIGCGVNRKTRTAFFTKNDSVIGKYLLSLATVYFSRCLGEFWTNVAGLGRLCFQGC